MSQSPQDLRCEVCGRDFPSKSIVSAAMVRIPIAELIRRAHPNWSEESHICLGDLNKFRGDYVEQTLKQERGELSTLEQEVVTSLREHELLAENLNEAFDQQKTFGERVSDIVASFGGSWTFIILFGCLIVAWIVLNTVELLFKAFDPYPFIFLNLVLSCVAAIQAPVIMMSQNRQQSIDRLRSEHDFRVNLKAELEIRQLHSKLDLLMTHLWQRLLDIQQLQTDLLQEIAGNRGQRGHEHRSAKPGDPS